MALPAGPALPPSPDLELPPSPDLAPEPELPPSPDLEPEPKLPPSPDLAPEPRLPPSPGLEPAAALLPPAPLAALAARLLRSFFFFLSLLAKKLSRLRSSVSAMAAVRMGGAGGGRGARGSELWVKAGCALRLQGAASPQPRGVAEARAAGRPAPPVLWWYVPRWEPRAWSRVAPAPLPEGQGRRAPASARLTTARAGGRRAGLRRGRGDGEGREGRREEGERKRAACGPAAQSLPAARPRRLRSQPRPPPRLLGLGRVPTPGLARPLGGPRPPVRLGSPLRRPAPAPQPAPGEGSSGRARPRPRLQPRAPVPRGDEGPGR